MPNTIAEKLSQVEARLIASDLVFGQGSLDAFDESLWLVGYVLKIQNQADWDESQILDQHQENQIDGLLDRRCDTKAPLAYLINQSWFAGYSFFVDERVIIPRSYLSEWVLEHFEPWVNSQEIKNVLDLCCGCGCIGISTALELPHTQVTLCDLSEQALEVANINVAHYALESRVSMVQGDLFEGLNEKSFDLILCNPPYVSSQRMENLPDTFKLEPSLAFAGGEDGLDFIRRFLKQATDYLSEDGVVLLEAGSASNALESEFEEIPFTWLSTEYDEMVICILTRQELEQYKVLF